MPVIPSLDEARRFARPALHSEGVATAEWAILLGAGALSAIVSLTIGSFRVPGSSILQAVLPMAGGMALVPRRGSGLAMGTTALATGMIMTRLSAWGVPHVNPSELARLLLLGVCLEVGPARIGDKRWVYLWFILAGLSANLLGFVIKLGMAQMGLEGLGGRGMPWIVRLASFALCGTVAGGISAAIFFRRGTSCSPQEGREP